MRLGDSGTFLRCFGKFETFLDVSGGFRISTFVRFFEVVSMPEDTSPPYKKHGPRTLVVGPVFRS